VNKIIFGEMYRDLKGELKKVYPVSGIEMRAVVRE
jgi:ribosomal protein S3AE